MKYKSKNSKEVYMRLTLSGYTDQLRDLINVDLLKYNRALDSGKMNLDYDA